MRHPFAGISVPQSVDSERSRHSTQLRPTRRTVVQGFLGGLSLAALPWEATAADDEQVRPGQQPAASGTHGRYLVVPADYRKFTAARRKELNVLGNFFSPAVGGKDQRQAAGGFLAWLTPEEAKALQNQADVASIAPIRPDDIPTPAASARKGEQEILIRLLPGDWKMRPKHGTYETADAIKKSWERQFKLGQGVSFSRGPQESLLVLEIGSQEPPRDLLAAIKEHPQVVGLQWMAERAPRPGGGVTTQALGEEGGATTLALGEEGATTKALGEEGGPMPTTRALGEEGALPPPTTEALGEEGAVPPKPGPVTTFALGEEG